MIIGTSGGDASAFPRFFFSALTKRAEGQEKFQIQLWTSGPISEEIDGALAGRGLLSHRLGQQSSPVLRKAINQGKVSFSDLPSGHFPKKIREGRMDGPDVAVIEAMAITEEGFIVPTTSVTDGPSHVQRADQVIVELNRAYPSLLEGIHDIYIPEPHPHRKPIPIVNTMDRVGTPYISMDPRKISCIIESDNITSLKESPPELDQDSLEVGRHVIGFLKGEVEKGRLPSTLLPLELGLGNMAEAVMAELLRCDLGPLEVYTAVIGDGILDLIDAGRVKGMSVSGLYFSQKGFDRFWKDLKKYKDHILLRPVEIADCPEVILRLGVIAINGALEADIYGHMNSTHLQGSQVITGVGGSGEFAQNGVLSIFMLPSSRGGGKISTIVPMVTHVDHSEHVVDVVITEQGVADLRGLDPVERAERMIENCSHPNFRPYLRDYLKRAQKESGGHEPQLLREAFSLHISLLEKGSML
jgi:succinyl-CoA:acetate CoA-transferase